MPAAVVLSVKYTQIRASSLTCSASLSVPLLERQVIGCQLTLQGAGQFQRFRHDHERNCSILLPWTVSAYPELLSARSTSWTLRSYTP